MHVEVDITDTYLYANLDAVIYMKQTTGYEIDYNKVYSDFATNRDDRVSMGGFITFIDETTIFWRTFQQKIFSLSTMEAEYVSLTEAANEFIWLNNEDFGKRNMPGKRARRHFSLLSEFERGLIIGMKTAGWSTHRVAGQVDHSECAVRNCWE
ncbi:retrovirus-related Pol polyprotein from transposon RE1 [Trichonephila clavipes]|nr:retrovirus-related Pol polyprotein from transposon RE1 [Trichonephila clavipes]